MAAKVAVIGAGNWGSAAAKIVAWNALRHTKFEDEVRLWVYEEDFQGRKLSAWINETRENPKYLPGIKLGDNIKATSDLAKAVRGARLLVFAVPHPYLKGLCPTVRSALDPDARAISLIKGIDVTQDGMQLTSTVLRQELGVGCSVLMGANIADEIAKELFSETTVGYEEGDEATGRLWQKLFHTDYFRVNAIPDVMGVELGGTLTAVVALAAGFCDGLELGNNAKAAIVRNGLNEIRRFGELCFPASRGDALFESAGVAEVITSCYGGRNRRCAEAFVRAARAGRPSSLADIQRELLHGQTIQGPLLSDEVRAVLRLRNLEEKFPLFTGINQICRGEAVPEALLGFAERSGDAAESAAEAAAPAAAPTGGQREKVAIIGSGNWGSVVAKIVASNAAKWADIEDEVRMWVFEEDFQGRKLSELINETQENPKYLPGIKLGGNVKACPDLAEAVREATLLIFVTPHQFVKGLCSKVRAAMAPGARAISLVKGMDVTEDGFQLISTLVQKELGVACSVLMGANIASEIARGLFAETTVGFNEGEEATARLWQRLFQTPHFRVAVTPDAVGVELCGTLKNLVAVGAGFCDGLGLGSNSKAAIVRAGLVEMMGLAQEFFPGVRTSTLFESAGVADLLTTCYGGRNRRCAEAYVQAIRSGVPRSFEDLEQEILNGQKLQGVLTSREVRAVLKKHGLEGRFPLFTTIDMICERELAPEALVRYADLRIEQ